MNTNKLAVLIGRMRPFHKGHESIVTTALKENDKLLILVGSSFNPRNVKNPFTFSEIDIMIRSCFSEEENSRIFIEPLIDHVYDDTKWITQVQKVVFKYSESDDEVTVYGNEKDHSSFYLGFFPQWNFRDIELVDDLHATDIRNLMFSEENVDGNWMLIKSKVPNTVYQFMKSFSSTNAFNELKIENKFIIDYKEAWKDAPYPPIFVTVDSVVECNGHILLIKRKHNPGKGLYALPGGFVNQFEKLEDAMLRELKEETKIDVSRNMLKGSIKGVFVADNPYRSLRGRTISHVYHLVINSDYLPEVKADDDAMNAVWFPIATIMEMNSQLFEDHGSVISYFTKTELAFKG